MKSHSLLIVFLEIAAILCVGIHGKAFFDRELMNAPVESGHRRLIVKYRDGVAASRLRIQSNTKSRLVMEDNSLGFAVVLSPETEVSLLEEDPNVLYVEEDSKIYPMAEVSPWGISHVKSNFVWNKNVNGAGVKVCVIDSGISANHEDFDYSKITGSTKDWNTDLCGHGTHVAGTIAAKKGNGKGVIGVAPEASLHIVKVFSGTSCAWSYKSGLLLAVQECVDYDPKIISMSLGGSSYSRFEDDLFKKVFDQGILSIAAAGNDNTKEYSYPASYEHVISVGATDISNQKAWFSQFNNQVDIAAPGISVYSTDSSSTSSYSYKSGTSMATPHVSGVAALIWSGFPQASHIQVRQALENSATDLGPNGRDDSFGHGLVNAEKAFEYLENLVSNSTQLIISDFRSQQVQGQNQLKLTWTTNLGATSEICYRLTSATEFECISKGEKQSTLHEMIFRQPIVPGNYIVQAKSMTGCLKEFSTAVAADFSTLRLSGFIYRRVIGKNNLYEFTWNTNLPSTSEICYTGSNWVNFNCITKGETLSTSHRLRLFQFSGTFRVHAKSRALPMEVSSNTVYITF